MDFSTASGKVSTSYYTTDDGVRRKYGSVIDMSDKTGTGQGTFGFIAPKTLNYLSFQSFDYERT
jgi:hypothetical protein